MGKVNLVIVLTINPAEKESLTHYLTNLSILYEQVGAKRIAKYDISETLIGDKSQTPTFSVIMEFPSMEALEKVFKGDKYEKLVPYLEKAFLEVRAYISKEQ